jgi:hypothetical protein
MGGISMQNRIGVGAGGNIVGIRGPGSGVRFAANGELRIHRLPAVDVGVAGLLGRPRSFQFISVLNTMLNSP